MTQGLAEYENQNGYVNQRVRNEAHANQRAANIAAETSRSHKWLGFNYVCQDVERVLAGVAG